MISAAIWLVDGSAPENLVNNLLHTGLKPLRSYCMSFLAAESPGDGLFWDTAEPYNYTRLQETPQGLAVIVGGQDHVTGDEREVESFARLEAYVRNRYKVTDVLQRWSAQLYDPADHLPFIGKAPLSDHIYVGTGYSGDGMTLGTQAGMMIAAQIQGRATAFDELFKPARLHLSGLKQFLEVNAHSARTFVLDRLRTDETDKVKALAPGEGCVARVGGRQVAAFREEDGELSTFSAVCPHLGWVVRWNEAHASFDCPCHGSRFSKEGKVLEGPSPRALKEIDVDLEKAAPGRSADRGAEGSATIG